MDSLRALAPHLLRYTGLYAGLVVAAAYAGSVAVGYSFGNAALLLALVGFVVGPVLFAVSDEGLDAAAAGGEVGFRGITDPSAMQPESLSFPGKAEVGLFMLGLAAWGVVALAALSA
ncbi:hypothetical protein [Halorarius halobius]|uniref:hypothetical protein n=1 Tax=Halorarius halobius TaxID=2962671 RepID=UPI0020CFB62B|nr:hypothetical protein [Halorarius halobius]